MTKLIGSVSTSNALAAKLAELRNSSQTARKKFVPLKERVACANTEEGDSNELVA